MSEPCAILAFARFMSPPELDALIQALAKLADLDWTLRVVVARGWSGAPHPPCVAARFVFTTAADWDAATDWDASTNWDAADLFACAVEPPDLDRAAADAFRHGIPVIACAAAPGTLITPETGLVCPPGDVEQLSKAIRRLIFDTGLRRDMAAAVRARARSF